MSEKQVCTGCGKEFARIASHVKFCKGVKQTYPSVPSILERDVINDVVESEVPERSFWKKLGDRLRNRGHKLK